MSRLGVWTQQNDSAPASLQLEPAPAAAIETDVTAIRRRLVGARQTVDLLEADLAVMVRDVQDAVGVVRQGMQKSVETNATIENGSASLATLAGHATDAASALAAGSIQLASASIEIGQQVHGANSLADRASQAASAADQSMSGLESSSAEIEGVVKLILSVAKETKMLALNAAIEAARAGEAGKAFAVVAHEVKALSLQTQAAADEISSKVHKLQRDAVESIKAVGRITNVIEELRPMFAAVASAVEEQTATTSSLSDRAAESSQFAAKVAAEAVKIGDLSRGAAVEGAAIDSSAKQALDFTKKLKSRFVISDGVAVKFHGNLYISGWGKRLHLFSGPDFPLPHRSGNFAIQKLVVNWEQVNCRETEPENRIGRGCARIGCRRRLRGPTMEPAESRYGADRACRTGRSDRGGHCIGRN